MLRTLIPSNAQGLRALRISALALAYLRPIALKLSLPEAHFTTWTFVGPRAMVLLAAIGIQLAYLAAPEHRKPNTVEIWRATLGAEIALLLTGLVLETVLDLFAGTVLPFPLDVLLSVGVLCAFVLVRPKVVINGRASTVTFGMFFPKRRWFSATQGIGSVEVGAQHWVGVFLPGSVPIKLCREETEADVRERVRQIAAYTGIPMASRQG